jgi:uncharacterized membrane-anchored protein
MERLEQREDKDDISCQIIMLHFRQQKISTKKKGTSARKLKSLVLFWSELVWSGGGE